MNSKEKLVHAVLTLAFLLMLSTTTMAQSVQEVRSVRVFENVVVEGSDNTFVYIRHDNAPGIRVKTAAGFMEKVKTVVSGNTLKIYFDTEQVGDTKVEIYITSPGIKRISLAGGGNIEMIDAVVEDRLQADIAGGGTVTVKDKGNVQNLQCTITGGGTVNASQLRVENANVTITGGGEVQVRVSNELDGNIVGGGNIFYEGDPSVASNVVGGGRVAKRMSK